MIDVPPPAEDTTAAPGWYQDPEAADMLRWWDGSSWSETDTRVDGDDGYPSWHPEFYRQRIRSALEAVLVKVAARTWWR
ncbi:DUF2510 domain-containing protein [Agromyces sp. NPDC056379]|uniref:DUF2510 domain-containing protein n=1 Tax=unclassified Agromyces TaxID=2639701 RepID=UPI0035D632E9